MSSCLSSAVDMAERPGGGAGATINGRVTATRGGADPPAELSMDGRATSALEAARRHSIGEGLFVDRNPLSW